MSSLGTVRPGSSVQVDSVLVTNGVVLVSAHQSMMGMGLTVSDTELVHDGVLMLVHRSSWN